MWVQMGAVEMFETFMPVLFMIGVWKCHLDTWFWRDFNLLLHLCLILVIPKGMGQPGRAIPY